MKMTPALKMGFDYLKEVGEVVKIEGYGGTPHEFTGENEIIKFDKYNRRIESPQFIRRINRQTLNKLISLGYAEYTDNTKVRVKFVDKDTAQGRLEREAKIGRAVLWAVEIEHAFESRYINRQNVDELIRLHEANGGK